MFLTKFLPSLSCRLILDMEDREGGRTISKECETMRTAMSFFPLFRPFIIREFVSLSMIGHCALRNLYKGNVHHLPQGINRFFIP